MTQDLITQARAVAQRLRDNNLVPASMFELQWQAADTIAALISALEAADRALLAKRLIAQVVKDHGVTVTDERNSLLAEVGMLRTALEAAQAENQRLKASCETTAVQMRAWAEHIDALQAENQRLRHVLIKVHNCRSVWTSQTLIREALNPKGMYDNLYTW